MNFKPCERMIQRIESSKDESDVSYFYDLLLYGEFITKITSVYIVSALTDDVDKTRYRFQYQLARANAVGDFSRIIDEILVGPESQKLSHVIRDFEVKELTMKATINDWQYDCQKLLTECLEIFSIETEKLNSKSPLRNWFRLFTILRNKTKGHGAPKTESCSLAVEKLRKSIDLLYHNFHAFKRSWVHLHRNLNGKFRVSKITEQVDVFNFLKTESDHNYNNGIYVYLDCPTPVPFLYTDTELSDFWISNGNYKRDSFETISYITNDTVEQCGKEFLQTTYKLPASHTEGLHELVVLNECLSNLPQAPDLYVDRLDLEEQLAKVLLENDRYPIVTLLGKGGTGKTSLALKVLADITGSKRFDLIIWFSARDIDLLMDGPKQVQTKIFTIEDIAKEYCNLVGNIIDKKEYVQYFSDQMVMNDYGTTLYVFDNFETVSNPNEVFDWINTYIRNPNKVLITSRISRDFKADYPIDIAGMNYEECLQLIESTSLKLNINDKLPKSYIEDLIEESAGHPYIIKILLGEVAKEGKIGKIKRIVADQDNILNALFKRTYNLLSPSSKRVFLTLCSWNSMVPKVALEAVLWRPANERMDVQGALEDLRRSSFIDISKIEDTEFVSVPLAASIFGKAELEVYPDKIKVFADRELLMEFGATTYNKNISINILTNLERKFKMISDRINNKTELEEEIEYLEYIATKFPKTYEYIIKAYEDFIDYQKVKHYVREYLKCNLDYEHKLRYWTKLADVCKLTSDWSGESLALSELAQLPVIDLSSVSNIANRINNHFYNDSAARSDDYKYDLLDIVIGKFKELVKNGDASDYSRLGWLLIHRGNNEEALFYVEEGLIKDEDNIHCLKLRDRLMQKEFLR